MRLHHYNDNHGLSLLGMDMMCCVAMDGVSQARDVSVVRVTAGRAAEAGTVVAEADVIWSQYRRWRPAANMAVTSEKTGKGSLMRPRLFTLRLRSHFYD